MDRQTGPQEDHHVAAQGPSEAIPSGPSVTSRVRKIVISNNDKNNYSITCFDCDQDISSILELLLHHCPNTVQTNDGQ